MQDFQGLAKEEDEEVAGNYVDAMSPNTKLGKAVRAAVKELDHLNTMVSPWHAMQPHRACGCHAWRMEPSAMHHAPRHPAPHFHASTRALPMMKQATVCNAVAELGACLAGMNLPSEPTLLKPCPAVSFPLTGTGCRAGPRHLACTYGAAWLLSEALFRP
jgi:hypothetical protein